MHCVLAQAGGEFVPSYIALFKGGGNSQNIWRNPHWLSLSSKNMLDAVQILSAKLILLIMEGEKRWESRKTRSILKLAIEVPFCCFSLKVSSSAVFPWKSLRIGADNWVYVGAAVDSSWFRYSQFVRVSLPGIENFEEIYVFVDRPLQDGTVHLQSIVFQSPSPSPRSTPLTPDINSRHHFVYKSWSSVPKANYN